MSAPACRAAPPAGENNRRPRHALLDPHHHAGRVGAHQLDSATQEQLAHQVATSRPTTSPAAVTAPAKVAVLPGPRLTESPELPEFPFNDPPGAKLEVFLLL
ncbi:hypothetical protein [Accumulibacter sp.]|uniref:hypothetical protein n=1 Tax=Accumulibacter sp. TaxID=2053492 RepID=UPI0025DC9B55|nr:hypothetical protein [Accumulibacter sp.]MCM8613114.1 hypothetical protein [Accumulibacter sp.]MCM8637080.1 hypothetical protein [Accumulibacter sp.]MCM8640122.1 hypothetical protein [Accumulibacter sp.]